MYSVLIVDDFAYDRRELKELVCSFEEMPLCVVGVCENGFEALEAVENLQPDILLCDVEMSGMDGVELVNALRARNNQVHIIFCSLYDKVHYLQSAIQLNCDGYLMKPIVREELKTCLQQIMMQLQNVQEQKETVESLRLAMADNRITLIKEFLSDVLMSHDYSVEYIRHRRKQLGLDDSLLFRLALLEVNSVGSATVQTDETSMHCFKTYQSLKRDTGWDMPYYVVRINERRYAVVFCYTAGAQSVEDTGHLTEQALGGFIARMRNCGVSITATFGSLFALLSDMRHQYEICRYRLNHRWQYGGDAVIFSDGADVHLNDAPMDTAAVQGEIRMLLELESEDINRAAREYVASLLNGQPLFQQQMICYYLLGIVHCAIHEDNLDWEMAKIDFGSYLQRVTALSSACECLAFASDLIVRAYSIIHQQQKSAGSDLIEQVKHCIRESDLKSIHMRLIAEKFSYSPNYLNHLFKTATGMTILDYITVCRIARAKELMQTTGMRLSEIAEEVGYSHATYLSIVFKKQEGVTPKQFMERNRL